MKLASLIVCTLLVANVAAILPVPEAGVAGSEIAGDADSETLSIAKANKGNKGGAPTDGADDGAANVVILGKGDRGGKQGAVAVEAKLGKVGVGQAEGVPGKGTDGKGPGGKMKTRETLALEARQHENRSTLGAATGMLIGVALVAGVALKTFGGKESDVIEVADANFSSKVTDTLLGGHTTSYGSAICTDTVTVTDTLLTKHMPFIGSDQRIV